MDSARRRARDVAAAAAELAAGVGHRARHAPLELPLQLAPAALDPIVVLAEHRHRGEQPAAFLAAQELGEARHLRFFLTECPNNAHAGEVLLRERREIAELGLHRLEAGTLPDNYASQRVLQKNGFERFGLARRLLLIDGTWQDHVLFERLSD